MRRRKQIEKPKTKSGQAQQKVKEQFLLVDGYDDSRLTELAELAEIIWMQPGLLLDVSAATRL